MVGHKVSCNRQAILQSSHVHSSPHMHFQLINQHPDFTLITPDLISENVGKV